MIRAAVLALALDLGGLAIMMASVDLPPNPAGCIRPEECR